jgi:hypothetical protein
MIVAPSTGLFESGSVHFLCCLCFENVTGAPSRQALCPASGRRSDRGRSPPIKASGDRVQRAVASGLKTHGQFPELSAEMN